jgi:hypothetical protein
MIAVQVSGISQEFNFRTRAQETFAVFLLPNGYSFRSSITDETAQVLIGMAIAGGESTPVSGTANTELPAPPYAPGSAFRETMAEDGTPSRVFGGEDVGGRNAIYETGPAPLDMDAAAPTVTPVRPKFVGRDDYGYPMTSAPGGVEPSSVTGSVGEGDEDGVRSV